MIIKAMIERENFYELLKYSLEFYYLTVFNQNVNIDFSKNKSDILIYENLGSIHRRNASYKVFHYWMNEYNIRNSIFKYLAVKIYVILSFVFKDLFGQRYMLMNNQTLFHESIAIIPANRKIRIFDFKNNYVDAIVKSGFTTKYFNNEVEFRNKATYEFVPKLIDCGDKWYREEILTGQPLARVRDKIRYDEAIRIVNDYVNLLIRDTQTYVDSLVYINLLYLRLIDKLKISNEIKHIKYYNEMVKVIETIKILVSVKNIKIKLVLSHGDLQTGNIWYCDGKITILDWETISTRSEWYDKLVLNFALRRSGKLKYLIDKIRLDNKFLNSDDSMFILGIVCLEDIEFYLDDMLELPRDYGAEIFNRISLEFINMGWQIGKT